MKRILVTGGNGQLGRCLHDLVTRDNNPAFTWIFTDVANLDICDEECVATFVARENIDTIVNCAAYTDVERAESDEATARRVNADAPGILGRVMKARGGRVIHISTDYVFGGGPGAAPRRENEPPAPLGVYGLTKYEGEQALRASGVSHIIIRTAWLYSRYGHNFLLTMMRLTAEKPELKVVFDQTGTPTCADDLAMVIAKFVTRRDLEGIYHYSNEGVCSWYDFAVAIARAAGHDRCRILPCLSHDFPSSVERPPYSVLDKSKIKAELGIEIPHWQNSMTRCMSMIIANQQ